MTWREYEIYITRHFQRAFPESHIRHDVKRVGVVSKTKRQIDMLIEERVAGFDVSIVIDCKFFSKKINVTHIDAFIGFLADVQASKGVLVTNKGFSKAAFNRATYDTARAVGAGHARRARRAPVKMCESSNESLPDRFPPLESGLRVHLVNQHVAPVTLLNDRLSGRGVARDHNDSLSGLESIAKRLLPRSVPYLERGHANMLVSIGDPGFDFMRVHLVSVRIRRLETVDANSDVFRVCREEMLGHVLGAARSKQFERLIAFEHPRRKDDVTETRGVIRMKMREEDVAEIRSLEPSDALAHGGRCASHDTRPRVYQVRGSVYDDGNGRTRSVGVGVRRARSQ